jgi:hypothetical protein
MADEETTQLADEDLRGMSPHDIVAARKAGRLDSLLAGTASDSQSESPSD